MKAKRSLVILAVLAVIIGITAACTRARSDAQVASEVQNKIYSDAAVQSRQVTVQASNGVVTLSGYVASDAERAAAANDAATIEGVKTVVNNLEAAAPAAAQAQPQQQQQSADQAEAQQPEPAPAPAPAPRRNTRERASASSSQRTTSSQRKPSGFHNTDSFSQPAPVETAATAPAPAVAPPPSAPAAPPVPAKVTIPDGTTFSIRLIDAVDSETAQPGQTFRASLDSPIVLDDNVVVPSGADVSGRIVDAKSAGRFAGKSALAVELTKLSYNGKTYSLHTNQYSREGSSRGASTAKRTGAGAAIGAIIGGLAGGGKGAAIGATVGGGAGAGSNATHKGEQIKFDTEQVLVFTLQSPLTVTPSSSMERNRNRQVLE